MGLHHNGTVASCGLGLPAAHPLAWRNVTFNLSPLAEWGKYCSLRHRNHTMFPANINQSCVIVVHKAIYERAEAQISMLLTLFALIL